MITTRHTRIRMQQVEVLARLSRCCRRKFGALILDPKRLQIVTDGYNGPPRGSKGDLCGGTTCDRETQCTISGTQTDVGCLHAEQNAILNAAYRGAALAGSWLFVQGEPCIGCARNIYHAGIEGVIIRGGGYSTEEGIEFLRRYGVEVKYAPCGNKVGVIIQSPFDQTLAYNISIQLALLMRRQAPLKDPYRFYNNCDVMSCENLVYVSDNPWQNERDPLAACLWVARSSDAATIPKFHAWEIGRTSTIFPQQPHPYDSTNVLVETLRTTEAHAIAIAAFELFQTAGGML